MLRVARKFRNAFQFKITGISNKSVWEEFRISDRIKCYSVIKYLDFHTIFLSLVMFVKVFQITLFMSRSKTTNSHKSKSSRQKRCMCYYIKQHLYHSHSYRWIIKSRGARTLLY